MADTRDERQNGFRKSVRDKGNSVMKKMIHQMRFLRALVIFSLFISSIIIHPNVCDSCPKAQSQSFMFTRPLTQNLAMLDAVWHKFIYEKKGCSQSSFQILTAFQQSVHLDNNANVHYFLPCKNEMLVSGDANLDDLAIRDIRAEWLGLPSDYRGRFTINPKQKQFGCFFEFNQNLGTLLNHSLFENMWVDVLVPLSIVENNINIKQTESSTSIKQFPDSILQAFCQQDWLYSKIGGQRSIMSLADFTIKLGSTYTAENDFVLGYYTIFVMPTGNKQDPAFLFSPVAGTNGHFGYGGGIYMQFLCNEHAENFALTMFIDFDSIFFARNKQKRTFNLKDKPLSRYLLFVEKNGLFNQTIPGVNVLTQECQVHPYGFIDFNIGFRLNVQCTELEFCYNIWGHSAEKIFHLKCPFPKDRYGIAGTPSSATGTTVVTASASTISTIAANDTVTVNCPSPCLENLVFVPIRECDIDLHSGEARSAFNHKVQLAASFINEGCKFSTFVGFGAFYDLPMKNAALNLIGAWIKGGISF